jgi:hypothetical protein
MLVIEVSVNAAAPDTTQQRPDWARADWDRAWREEIKGAETAEAWSKFRSKIEEVVRDCVPLKKPRSANRPPWMTTEILRAVRRKKRLWKRDKHKADKTEYKEQEKKTRNLIRNAKKRFERRLADGGTTNKRPFYAYVKNRTKTRQSVGPLRDETGEKVTGNLEMAGLLNTTFGKAFTREDEHHVPDPDESHQGDELRNIRVTVKEVRNKIKKLRREAAPGPDGIGPVVLKELEDELAPVLATIFNKSLEKGEVPGGLEGGECHANFQERI